MLTQMQLPSRTKPSRSHPPMLRKVDPLLTPTNLVVPLTPKSQVRIIPCSSDRDLVTGGSTATAAMEASSSDGSSFPKQEDEPPSDSNGRLQTVACPRQKQRTKQRQKQRQGVEQVCEESHPAMSHAVTAPLKSVLTRSDSVIISVHHGKEVQLTTKQRQKQLQRVEQACEESHPAAHLAVTVPLKSARTRSNTVITSVHHPDGKEVQLSCTQIALSQRQLDDHPKKEEGVLARLRGGCRSGGTYHNNNTPLGGGQRGPQPASIISSQTGGLGVVLRRKLRPRFPSCILMTKTTRRIPLLGTTIAATTTSSGVDNSVSSNDSQAAQIIKSKRRVSFCLNHQEIEPNPLHNNLDCNSCNSSTSSDHLVTFCVDGGRSPGCHFSSPVVNFLDESDDGEEDNNLCGSKSDPPFQRRIYSCDGKDDGDDDRLEVTTTALQTETWRGLGAVCLDYNPVL